MSPVNPDLRVPAIRYHALDGYRFVAAMCIVVHHYDVDFAVGLGKMSPMIGRLNAFVDFFFILSGFVIATTYASRMSDVHDYLRFLRARIARLYPLHLLTLAAAMSFLVFAAASGAKPNHPEILSLGGLPANLGLMHAWGVLDHHSFNSPSWSISAEWFAYLLAPAFFFVAWRAPLWASLAATVAFVVAMSAARQAAGLGPWYEASYDFGSLRAVPGFFLGVVLAAHIGRLQEIWSPSPWLAPALFLGALAALHFGAPHMLVYVLFLVIVAATALCERAGEPGFMGTRPMQSLSDISYTVYMTHVVMAVPALFVARKLGMIGGVSGALLAFATACVVVATGMLVYRHFEIPAKELILGRRALPRSAAAMSETGARG